MRKIYFVSIYFVSIYFVSNAYPICLYADVPVESVDRSATDLNQFKTRVAP